MWTAPRQRRCTERSGAALRTSPARAHSKNAARAKSNPEKQDERDVRVYAYRAAGSGNVHSTTAAAAHRALRGEPGTVGSQGAHLRHGSSRCSAFSPSSSVLRLVGRAQIADRPASLSLTVHTRGDSLRCCERGVRCSSRPAQVAGAAAKMGDANRWLRLWASSVVPLREGGER
jgi:hypothetical protein